jgi:hypothetical protein
MRETCVCVQANFVGALVERALARRRAGAFGGAVPELDDELVDAFRPGLGGLAGKGERGQDQQQCGSDQSRARRTKCQGRLLR